MAFDGVIIDTQLLVLLAVGSASPAYIERHKRVNAYSRQDYDLLCRIVAPARRIVVTPHVLAETSNLLRQIAEPERSAVMDALARLIGVADERHVPGRDVSEQAAFVRLGLTDAALLALGSTSTLLLTTDNALYLAASQAGRQVENFNHARAAHG